MYVYTLANRPKEKDESTEDSSTISSRSPTSTVQEITYDQDVPISTEMVPFTGFTSEKAHDEFVEVVQSDYGDLTYPVSSLLEFPSTNVHPDDEVTDASLTLTTAAVTNSLQPTAASNAFVTNSFQPTAAPNAFSLLDSIHLGTSPFSWLSAENRALLDHFMSCTTTALSCHQLVRQEINSVLIPLAAQAPYLLTSLLCLAATNRISLGLEQSTLQLDRLKTVSIRQLLNALSNPRCVLDDAVIASVLVLCTTDIVSVNQNPGSWRSHLQGAATILSENMKHANSLGLRPTSLTYTSSFFWRWFISIETASLMSGGKSVVPSSMPRLFLATRAHSELLFAEDEIDDFAGFSTSLIHVFSKIKQLEADIADPNCDKASISARCGDLISHINERIVSHRPYFRPDVAITLSIDHRLDFTAINVSFHHVALLRIYRNVCRLPSSDTLVQDSVSTIISLCASTKLLREPCPRVAVLQPLFAAGCEAIHDADKKSIKSLLERQEMAYGLGNARDARLFLEELWKRREHEMDFEGRLRWDEVMCKFTASPSPITVFAYILTFFLSSTVEKGLDILPY